MSDFEGAEGRATGEIGEEKKKRAHEGKKGGWALKVRERGDLLERREEEERRNEGRRVSAVRPFTTLSACPPSPSILRPLLLPMDLTGEYKEDEEVKHTRKRQAHALTGREEGSRKEERERVRWRW